MSMPIQRQSDQFSVFDTGTRWARDKESHDLPKGLAGLVNSMGPRVGAGMLDTRTAAKGDDGCDCPGCGWNHDEDDKPMTDACWDAIGGGKGKGDKREAGWHYPEYDPRVDGYPEEDLDRPSAAEFAEEDYYRERRGNEDYGYLRNLDRNDPSKKVPGDFVDPREARRRMAAHLDSYRTAALEGDHAELARLNELSEHLKKQFFTKADELGDDQHPDLLPIAREWHETDGARSELAKRLMDQVDPERPVDMNDRFGQRRRASRLPFDRAAAARLADKDSGCTCWEGYERVPGTKPCADGSCRKKTSSFLNGRPDHSDVSWQETADGWEHPVTGCRVQPSDRFADEWEMLAPTTSKRRPYSIIDHHTDPHAMMARHDRATGYASKTAQMSYEDAMKYIDETLAAGERDNSRQVFRDPRFDGDNGHRPDRDQELAERGFSTGPGDVNRVAWEGKACPDCAMAIANGDDSGASPDWSWDNMQSGINSLPGDGDVVLSCGEDDDCDSNFQRGPCDLCGNPDSGTFHPVVTFERNRQHEALLRRLAQMSYEDAMKYIDEQLAAGEARDPNEPVDLYDVDEWPCRNCGEVTHNDDLQQGDDFEDYCPRCIRGRNRSSQLGEYPVKDHPGHSRHQKPDWEQQGMTAEEWNEAGRPGWVTNNPRTAAAEGLDDLTQRKALNLVKGWMGRNYGHEDEDVEVQSGDRAYRSGGGLKLHPAWVGQWRDPFTGEMNDYDPSPAILHEGQPGWADEASVDEDLVDRLHGIGVHAENHGGYAMTLHRYDDKPFSICRDCSLGYDAASPTCPECGTPNHNQRTAATTLAQMSYEDTMKYIDETLSAGEGGRRARPTSGAPGPHRLSIERHLIDDDYRDEELDAGTHLLNPEMAHEDHPSEEHALDRMHEVADDWGCQVNEYDPEPDSHEALHGEPGTRYFSFDGPEDEEVQGYAELRPHNPKQASRTAAGVAQDPAAMAPVMPAAGGYQPGHRVGLPWRDQVVRGTVIGLDGDMASIRWDDGQYSSEEPHNIQLL